MQGQNLSGGMANVAILPAGHTRIDCGDGGPHGRRGQLCGARRDSGVGTDQGTGRQALGGSRCGVAGLLPGVACQLVVRDIALTAARSGA